MSIAALCLPPSSCLPPIRSLRDATEATVVAALQNLQAVYCPLRFLPALPKHKAVTAAQADSGYASRDEVSEYCAAEATETLALLRADDFERTFTVRWLTSLISRADEISFDSEDLRESVVDDAAFILSSFSDTAGEDADDSLTRDFSFPTSQGTTVDIQLNDAPLSGSDYTDVGLQSWGASIVLSHLLCAEPWRFGLSALEKDVRVVELGAGTGLISLVLAKLILGVEILATDYHPTVLENLRANIATNFPDDAADQPPVDTMLLDWAAPPASFDSCAQMLFAADVVYAPEHAIWLRDCAASLLLPDGLFWLVVTVRKVGKFEGIPETAEAAFTADGGSEKDGKALRIVEKTTLDKKRGIGGGDESGYMLFKIAWV